MNFILINWVKYYTKEAVKTLKLITIGSAIVITIVCIKYKPAYEVTISGETIGFVNNVEIIKAKIEKYIEDTTDNIAFREISELPEYELKLIDREKETEEKDIMLAIQNLTTTTYKAYAITSDGEQKAIVGSQEEAQNIINEIKLDLKEEVDLKLGIIDIYSTELNVNSKEDAVNMLNQLKVTKLAEYENQKAEQERIAQEAAKIAAQNATSKRKAKSIETTTRVASSGSINGIPLSIPVNGSITSRFGARSKIRSSAHTGLDIAASSGTGIRPISSGTVSYAGYKGSYGKLIIVDHGNGIQSYYAHCSSLYVSVGETVDTNTTIGAVGSTGNSTGPHLHLEIRVNETPVNPQNYLY